MARNTADYAITFGLSGCYMPDSGPHTISCATRAELANAIRAELENYDFPASLFREVRIRRLWSFITRNGSSVAHFHLSHGGHTLAFHGLTKAELAEAEAE
jgi:hypothetical protein